jgi:hypothetical protein
MAKKEDSTTPKAFRHWDPPGRGRKLVMHLYETDIPLCEYLMKKVGLTEDQLVRLAAFMQECIVAEVPEKDNRFLQAGGKVAGVMITKFPFTILGSLPKKARVPFWTDVEAPKKKRRKGK